MGLQDLDWVFSGANAPPEKLAVLKEQKIVYSYLCIHLDSINAAILERNH